MNIARKHLLTTGISALLLISTPVQARTSPATNRLTAILFRPAPSQSGANYSPPTTARIRNVVRTVTRTNYRTIYVAAKHTDGLVEFNGKTVAWKHKPVILNDTLYVPLRETLAVMGQYGLRSSIDYQVVNGKHLFNVDIQPIATSNKTFESLFGQGLYQMWHGRVKEAVDFFREAEGRGGGDADDAKGMADWLSEEKNTSIIRFAWWALPTKIKVLVDNREIEPGTVMVAVPAGNHHLQLLNDKDEPVYTAEIRVDLDKAFVVEFGARPRSEE